MARKNSKPQLKLYEPPPIDMGLFNWHSRLSEAEQVEITNWYRSLPTEQRRFVDAVRSEGYEDGHDDGRVYHE